ncbi:TniQ family protein [Streptomyces sp. NPDC088244]|uniref:TniQ family protein n=1 Tax=Streptomyces sp. NPDC088244 TaxID=3365841 RepID=UPI0038278461
MHTGSAFRRCTSPSWPRPWSSPWPAGKSATHPSVRPSLEERSSRSWNDSWLFVTPRHCPRCLGGDGSPLGQQLGGAWQKAWHLPVVFACLGHRLYLSHECPKCHDSADEADLLIHRANDSVLHPAQCRRRATTPSPVKRITPACGARLDTAQSHSAKVRPHRQASRLPGTPPQPPCPRPASRGSLSVLHRSQARDRAGQLVMASRPFSHRRRPRRPGEKALPHHPCRGQHLR